MKGRACRTGDEVSNAQSVSREWGHPCSKRRDQRQDVSGGKSCDHRVFAQTGRWRVSHWHYFGLQHLGSPQQLVPFLRFSGKVMTSTRQRSSWGARTALDPGFGPRSTGSENSSLDSKASGPKSHMVPSGCGGTYCDGSADRRRFQVPGHPNVGSGRHLATRPLRNAAEPVGRRLLANFGQPRKRECRERHDDIAHRNVIEAGSYKIRGDRQ